MYILGYDKNKTFTGGIRMDISFTNGAGQLLKIRRDYRRIMAGIMLQGPVAGLSGTLALSARIR